MNNNTYKIWSSSDCKNVNRVLRHSAPPHMKLKYTYKVQQRQSILKSWHDLIFNSYLGSSLILTSSQQHGIISGRLKTQWTARVISGRNSWVQFSSVPWPIRLLRGHKRQFSTASMSVFFCRRLLWAILAWAGMFMQNKTYYIADESTILFLVFFLTIYTTLYWKRNGGKWRREDQESRNWKGRIHGSSRSMEGSWLPVS